jgi:2-polyprenyl-3-methyl-5-hydroxy-6-metoxy-1,4-benzoquinol methylase
MFPDRVIESFLEHLDLAYVPDAIARHEDPAYVAGELDRLISAYFGPDGLNGMRVLDFGCGSGASTFALASKWTEATIIGVELNPEYIALARDIQEYRKYANVEFHQSPGPESLPPGIGDFDAIVLSAVYEHLLPAEREYLLPMLWSFVRPGGYVLITETPHRLSPVETHSTGIVGINYVPDSMAAFMAAKWARKHQELNRSRSWKEPPARRHSRGYRTRHRSASHGRIPGKGGHPSAAVRECEIACTAVG